MKLAEINSRGQITIPLEIREKLHLRAGEHEEEPPQANQNRTHRVPEEGVCLDHGVGYRIPPMASQAQHASQSRRLPRR